MDFVSLVMIVAGQHQDAICLFDVVGRTGTWLLGVWVAGHILAYLTLRFRLRGQYTLNVRINQTTDKFSYPAPAPSFATDPSLLSSRFPKRVTAIVTLSACPYAGIVANDRKRLTADGPDNKKNQQIYSATPDF